MIWPGLCQRQCLLEPFQLTLHYQVGHPHEQTIMTTFKKVCVAMENSSLPLLIVVAVATRCEPPVT